ncbi:hypothetical protein DH2020_009659 [Rehmannia glutinosa]|uniref:NERD domain-containing protein n=1 Tax=Rehmannia glutinosa TaxID=99300 RepID=A0ABR0X875_REHGL
MWGKLICAKLICGLGGLVLYHLVKRHFFEDDVDSSALFAVARRLEKLHQGCKVYVGLRIPDPDSASRRDIDIVLVTNQDAVVISVKNVSGIVSIGEENNWVAKNHITEHLPDPVAETKQLVPILEGYLKQRGVSLPQEYLSFKVICPNPSFRSGNSDVFPPEVITYDQWIQLKPEQRSLYSEWIKGPLLGWKKEPFSEKLNSVLSTAPIWDRLELKDKKYILGEFIEFKGKQDDLKALGTIKRSKVSLLTIKKTIMIKFGHMMVQVQVLFTPRDYRVEGIEGPSSSSGWDEVNVTSNTQIVFQPQNSKKPRKYKLSSVVSMLLSG